MAYAMTKQGSLDNCITYEFICDTTADMNAIENRYRTIGTVAIVLQGESEGLEVYIAGSNKQWNSLGGFGGSDATGSGGLSIHICTSGEVTNGVPNIQEPDETTIYLVSSGNETGNLYEEYIYVNNAWEKFGAASIDLSGYVVKQNAVVTGSLSMGRKANTTVGSASTALGNSVTASGSQSYAEGNCTNALGSESHAEGSYTTASGNYSHAEGQGGDFSLNGSTYTSMASGDYSHTEGEHCIASAASAHAEGSRTRSTGFAAHTEGQYTLASNSFSHAEGLGGTYTNSGTTYTSVAAGTADHTEGFQCLTAENQPGNHAEGYQTRATGGAAHSEGSITLASGSQSHAEGSGTIASGTQSHAEGYNTTASGSQSHAEGAETIASGALSHAEGASTTASGNISHAEGSSTIASHAYTHSEGGGTLASGPYSHAEGAETIASGTNSHAEGYTTTALGYCEHVSGIYNKLDDANTWVANTSYSVGQLVKRNETYTDGGGTTRTITKIYKCKTANSDSTFNSNKWDQSGQYLFVVGNGTSSSRSNAFSVGWGGNVSEGSNTTATGNASHAEGGDTTASGTYSHAEGQGTTASGYEAHAEGGGTQATGSNSHAEGSSTTASGINAHTEGSNTIAAGHSSHVGGILNIVDSYDNWDEWVANASYEVGDKVKVTSGSGTSQTVNGYICKTANSDSSFTSSHWTDQYGKMNYVEIIGNGIYPDRSNARTLDWEGNAWYAGNITAAGGTLTLGSGNNAVSITAAQLETLLSLANATGVSF